MSKPKECINSNCNKIIYVEDCNLHLPLQCEDCINKKLKDE
jgi:hypothetical protein